MVRFVATHATQGPRLPSGWRLKRFPALDSTNSALKRMIASGAGVDEGTVVMADTQTEGRGRSGRPWVSPPGNLYCSILLKAAARSDVTAQLGFVAGVALVEAIQSLWPDRASDDRIRLKWPNDALCEGAKFSGLLLEAVTDPVGGEPLVILGLGVDLNPTPGIVASYPVTSLVGHGMTTTPVHFLESFCHAFAPRLREWRDDGFAPIRAAWLARALPVGTALNVTAGGETLTGPFAGLDDDGALLLALPDGPRRIVAGDAAVGGA